MEEVKTYNQGLIDGRKQIKDRLKRLIRELGRSNLMNKNKINEVIDETDYTTDNI